MKVLFLNWRDLKNPQSGGAEIITHELAKALVETKHDVYFFTAKFEGCKNFEKIDGIKIFRSGSKFTVPWHAYKFYRAKKYFDLVIDECNTNQFFTPLYVPKKKRIFYINQLTRKIWFYQLAFPLNVLGYLLEPLFLFLQRQSYTITISKSTKEHLVKFGFNPKKISVIPVGIDFKPDVALLPLDNKKKGLSLIFVGRLVEYKRVHDVIKVVYFITKALPKLRVTLEIVGKGEKKYVTKLRRITTELGLSKRIRFYGHISFHERNKMMRQSFLILATSLLEGWGLIVSEANALGTPACVYNVGGLRDSTKHNFTGIVTEKNTPKELAKEIIRLYNDKQLYMSLRYNAWKFSKTLTFDKMKLKFLEIANKIRRS